MQSRGHWSTVRSWRRTNWWGIFGIKHQIQRCWKIIFLLILLSLGIKPFKGQYFCAGQWPWSQQSHSGLIQHSFFIKYCSHIFINCVYWFDRTTAEAWENGTDCKCFYPMANVSRKPQFDLIIRRPNLSPFQEVFMWWCSVTMFIIPTLLIILIWGVMAHHFATENESRLGKYKINRSEQNYFHLSLSSSLKSVTIKMVLLAGLFLLTIGPYCLVFLAATISPPISSTMWLDRTLPLSLLNGMLNPVIYIAMISTIREAFANKICYRRSNPSL